MIVILVTQLACLLAQVALGTGAFHLFAGHSARRAEQVTERAYNNLQHQSLSYFQTRGQSELIQLLRGDVALLESGFSQFAGQVLISFSQIVVVLVLLFIWQPWFALFGLVGLLGAFSVSVYAARVADRLLRVEINSNIALCEHILRTLGLHGMLLLMQSESGWASSRTRRLLEKHRTNLVRRQATPQWLLQGGFAVGHIVSFVFYLTGGYFVSRGQLSIGQLVALAALLSYLTSVTMQLGSFLIAIQDGLLRLRRIHNELSQTKLRHPHRSLRWGQRVNGHYELSEVDVIYPGTEKGLFDVTAVIPAQAVTVIVGKSGAGKTTLACTMLKLLEQTAGSIALDGRSLSDIPRSELHKNVAYVPQEPVLFRGSLRENLLLGRCLDNDQLEQACREAHIHSRIFASAEGLDVDVGEAGSIFSAGERQRLAIARALVGRPSVLVLDEPTAHLDPLSQRLVQQAIAAQTRQGTTIVVLSHTLPANMHVDWFLALDEGRLVAQGRPAADGTGTVVADRCSDCAPLRQQLVPCETCKSA